MGTAIINHQAVAFMLADMAIGIELGRLMVRRLTACQIVTFSNCNILGMYAAPLGSTTRGDPTLTSRLSPKRTLATTP
jgi:alkylation response protein AidB-like acyl-CoA dehydrogenase